MRIVDAHETLLEYYMQRHSPNETVHALASSYVEGFKPLRNQMSVAQFDYFVYSIEFMQLFSANNITAVANEEKILFTLNQCLGFTEEGRYNWFIILHLAVYCYAHHKLYDKACEAFMTGYRHQRFYLQSVRLQEEWRLLGAYLHLLVELDELQAPELEAAIGPFKVTKFENDFLELPRDKEGVNIPIVILPAVYALAKSDFEAFEAQIDKLDKYRERYLENELNQRSARFLQMMFALAKQKYAGSVRSEGRLRQEIEKLHALTPQVARQNFAIEVIPYENLWELLAKKLEP